MRQHKYKAWHKAEKVMCDVSIINFDKGAFLIGVKPGKDEIYDKGFVIAPTDGRFCDWDEIELLEFTGLKDKNGVEIYEGDIVEYVYGNNNVFSGIVEYHNKTLYVGWEKDETLFIGFILRSSPGTDQEYFTEVPHIVPIEIIGNIHSNPT